MILDFISQLLFGKSCKICLVSLAVKFGSKNQICSTCFYDIEKKFQLSRIQENVFVIFPYQYEIQKLIQKGKYKNDKYIWRIWSVFLERSLKQIADKDTIICPVPSSKKRLQDRGFNQVEEMLKCVDGFKYQKLVKRVKHLESATLLNRKARLKNLNNCFQMCDKTADEFKNEKVLIVDDVLTTGSTMKQMFKIFEDYGFLKENIYGLCLTSPRLNPD